jgi:hypothetical protein
LPERARPRHHAGASPGILTPHRIRNLGIPSKSVHQTNTAVDAAVQSAIYAECDASRSLRHGTTSIFSLESFMADYRVSPGQAQEDQLTASIEKQTSQIPSSAYLAAALGAMAVSAGFHLARKQHSAIFIGQWAAPFLLLGIYNKLVKQHGSDAASRTLIQSES